MGFISVDATGEERREEARRQKMGAVKFGKGVGMESRESAERRPEGDRVIGMFSHTSPPEGHQSSLSHFRHFFLYKSQWVFFSPSSLCNNPLPPTR